MLFCIILVTSLAIFQVFGKNRNVFFESLTARAHIFNMFLVVKWQVAKSQAVQVKIALCGHLIRINI